MTRVMVMMTWMMVMMTLVMVKAVILNTLAISRQRAEQSYLAQPPLHHHLPSDSLFPAILCF